MSDEFDRVTELLRLAQQGVPGALNDLIALLYARFRQRAHQRLRDERAGHSFATTDLTNEALVRLLQSAEFAKAADRPQLDRAFARAVRQVLIDHSRRRNAEKRGGGRRREVLDDLAEDVSRLSRLEVLALDEALTALAAEDADAAEVLELRYFGGHEMTEIAAIRGRSLSTIERDLRFGRRWLRVFLSPAEER